MYGTVHPVWKYISFSEGKEIPLQSRYGPLHRVVYLVVGPKTGLNEGTVSRNTSHVGRVDMDRWDRVPGRLRKGVNYLLPSLIKGRLNRNGLL